MKQAEQADARAAEIQVTKQGEFNKYEEEEQRRLYSEAQDQINSLKQHIARLEREAEEAAIKLTDLEMLQSEKDANDQDRLVLK